MNATYNCVIIDDEPAPREILAKYIARHPALHLENSFDEAPEALSYLKKNKPDIIFLDIEMPDLTGIQLIEKLDISPAHYIFVTAHSQYAHESYNLNVPDYMTKPPSYERFKQSVSKVLKVLHHFREDTLVLDIGRKRFRIPKSHIDWIEAENYHVKIYGNKFSEDHLALRVRLHQLEDLLPKEHFLKLNRSAIVKMKYIKSIRNNEVTLRNDKKITISRSCKWVKSYIENQLRLQ